MTDFIWNADALISSGVGAFIGSALTLAGAYWVHWLERQDAALKEKEQIFGVLQGIHDEIETLWDSYLSTVGSHVESLREGNALMLYWPVTQDYFTIYNSNASLIGKISDHDLRKYSGPRI